LMIEAARNSAIMCANDRTNLVTLL
jgi:hypothetical protein